VESQNSIFDFNGCKFTLEDPQFLSSVNKVSVEDPRDSKHNYDVTERIFGFPSKHCDVTKERLHITKINMNYNVSVTDKGCDVT
jgi:hypothetical protein